MSKAFFDRIPISVSLDSTLEAENLKTKSLDNKKRIAGISMLAIIVAITISLIAKLLIHLIDLITNISFYGNYFLFRKIEIQELWKL